MQSEVNKEENLNRIITVPIKRVTRTDVEEYAEEEIASSFIVPNEK